MGRILKRNTLVRKGGAFGKMTPLYAGEELPEWAEGLVGDHLFEEAKVEKAERPKPKPSLPKHKPVEEPEPAKVEVPHRGAHHTQWRKFLEAGKVDVPAGTSREEMISIAEDRFPGIEIPDDEE